MICYGYKCVKVHQADGPLRGLSLPHRRPIPIPKGRSTDRNGGDRCTLADNWNGSPSDRLRRDSITSPSALSRDPRNFGRTELKALKASPRLFELDLTHPTIGVDGRSWFALGTRKLIPRI